MKSDTFSHIKEYDLEIDRLVNYIKENKCKSVAIQFPDGLKCHAHKVADELREKTGVEVIIWAGSSYGACDLAVDVQRLQCDLLVHWGHAEWKYGSTF